MGTRLPPDWRKRLTAVLSRRSKAAAAQEGDELEPNRPSPLKMAMPRPSIPRGSPQQKVWFIHTPPASGRSRSHFRGLLIEAGVSEAAAGCKLGSGEFGGSGTGACGASAHSRAYTLASMPAAVQPFPQPCSHARSRGSPGSPRPQGQKPAVVASQRPGKPAEKETEWPHRQALPGRNFRPGSLTSSARLRGRPRWARAPWRPIRQAGFRFESPSAAL